MDQYRAYEQERRILRELGYVHPDDAQISSNMRTQLADVYVGLYRLCERACNDIDNPARDTNRLTSPSSSALN